MPTYPDVPPLISHNHNVVTGVKFYTYSGAVDSEDHRRYTMVLSGDWTQYVIDYSYDCDVDDNTRTSASVTLSSFAVTDAVVAKIEHETTKNAPSQEGHMWDENTFYRLVKTYDFPANPSLHYEWDLGYFICNNNSSEISTTSNTVTLSLIGLSAILQPEYGGTPSRYRQGITTNVVYKEVTPHIAGWSTHPTPEGEYVVHYSGSPDPNNKPTESGSPIYTDEKFWDVVYKMKTLTNWSLMTLYIKHDTILNNELLFDYIMGTWAFETSLQDMSRLLPLQGCIMDMGTCKLGVPIIYEDKEFPYDASRQDIANFILDQVYIEGHYWVDENLYFHMKGKEETYSPITTYDTYGELVINETRSYDDTNVFNSVNVVSHTTFGEVEYTFFGRAENPHTIQTSNMRGLYIENNTLQSDEECEDLAELEVQNTSWGHETFTVTLVDNYCGFLMNTSNQVGRMIEYKTFTGYTVPCILQKVSYSSNTITLVLKVFDTSTPFNSDTSE